MTGDDPRAPDGRGDRSPSGGDLRESEEGRYVFCVVAGDHADADFSTAGIEGGEVRLLSTSGVTAVVQPRARPFDSDDPATVRRWLLQHQRVVDEAGEAFGTPLPFQFDTVLVGGVDRVHGWLNDHADELSAALEELSGRWEYRIDVVWDEDGLADRLATGDERLDELEAEREDADEGRGFLLEKQYDRRLRELVAAHRAERASAVGDRLEDFAEEVRRIERSVSLLDDGERADEESGSVARFSVLAREADAESIGEYLETVADDPAVTVRFTGPWPPYSFAPTVGGER